LHFGSAGRELAKYNDSLKQEKEAIPLINIRIGIYTGLVVVGTLGNDLRIEFEVVGNTINLT